MRSLPAPLLVGLLALCVLWLMGRWDGAQTARIAELDRQTQAATELTLLTAKRHKATERASVAARAEIARLRAAQQAAEASRRDAETRANRWKDSAEAVLAGLDSGTAKPVRQFITALQDQIAAAGELQRLTRAEADSLAGEATRWKGQARDWQADAGRWKVQSEQWEKEAKSGCLPLVGCVSRTVVFVTGAAAGLAGSAAF